jgi:hypothetical protein
VRLATTQIYSITDHYDLNPEGPDSRLQYAQYQEAYVTLIAITEREDREMNEFTKTELELIFLFLFKLTRHDVEAVVPDVVVDETVDALI